MNLNITHLNMEVTRRCNQRCDYCFNASGLGSPATELTLEEWLDILRHLKARGLESIHLTGGEPFVYERSVDLLAGAQALGLRTSILSNGFRIKQLTQQSPEVFASLVVAQISLDSMNRDTHNCRRNYARAWQDAVDAVNSLRLLEVKVEISCVVSDLNISDVSAVADFCKTSGTGLIIRPLLPLGRASRWRLPESFTYNLDILRQSLRDHSGTHLVDDRFYYLPDETVHISSSRPAGYFTARSDGVVKCSSNSELNESYDLMDLVA